MRCPWCGNDPLYVAYHDEEWGRPEFDSRQLWEMLMLEGFQAGLSWITILRRREGFREAFEGFNPEVISKWGAPEVERLVQDSRIIRHRGKIEATITAARLYLEIEAAEGFSTYLWSFVQGQPYQRRAESMADIPPQNEVSLHMSKALKKRGFKFVGPSICYAFMQASGMVNDHLNSCPQQVECAAIPIPPLAIA